MKGIIGKDVESQWENELMIEDDKRDKMPQAICGPWRKWAWTGFKCGREYSVPRRRGIQIYYEGNYSDILIF